MFNFIELTYVLNGTSICLQNLKNKLYLSLNMSNYNFQVTGYHPYLANHTFETEIKQISKFKIVLSSMPNYTLNSPKSTITFGTQISLISPNNMFLVATNNGELKLESLKGDMSLSSINLPINSKFTIIDPYNQNNFSKPFLFNDEFLLRSTFGGYLSLNLQNNDNNNFNYDNINQVITNNMIIVEDCIWKVIKTNVPYIPDWVFKRKYLNYNINSYLYTLENSFMNKGNKINLIGNKNSEITTIVDKSKPNLSTLSTNLQDKNLVDDILLTMLGLEGNYIKRVITHTNFKDFKVEFQVEPYLENPTCDPPLLSLVNLLLPISFYYNSITNFLNIHSNIETGLIGKSFCLGLKKILREYILFVNQLDCQNRIGNPNLNLQQLWWLCQPSLKLLENLHELCQKCSMIKGGALINIIYSVYLHETDNQMKKMYKFLLDRSFVPYFDMLKLWTCHGYLENEHEFQEFMIMCYKDYNKENVKESYLDLFWEMKFKLNNLHVPEFLNRVAEKILFIGKSLNIIRETGKIIQCPFEKEFESFSTKEEGNKIINNKKNFFDDNNNINGYNNNGNKNNNLNNINYNNVNVNIENNQMIFENERLIQFEKLINKIYNWTNDSLRHILFKEKNLDSLLKSFKKFYLMEAGDFFTELIESAKDLFFLEKKNINFEKLKILIDNSIRMTSINSDINKDHFNFFLSNMAISMEKQYLDKYSEILQSNETDIKKITEKIYEIDNTQSGIDLDDMKVYETLNLECKIDWPLNLIFSKKNIIKYKILFRHLLRMKFLEKELNDVWLITQYFKDDKLQSYIKECNFLRDNMLNFVKNIIYYLFNEVIEPNYISLQKNLENSSSMEDVMKYHDQFLNNCINQCLLGNENILIQLSNMIQCISYFSKLTSKYFQNILIKEKEIHQENIGIRYMKITNEFDRKRLKKKERIEAIESVLIQGQDKFKGMFDKFKEGFEKRFKNFLNEINKINISYNPHLTNLLTKLDFNNYYCDRFNKLI